MVEMKNVGLDQKGVVRWMQSDLRDWRRMVHPFFNRFKDDRSVGVAR